MTLWLAILLIIISGTAGFTLCALLTSSKIADLDAFGDQLCHEFDKQCSENTTLRDEIEALHTEIELFKRASEHVATPNELIIIEALKVYSRALHCDD